jgi:hypothetical protein
VTSLHTGSMQWRAHPISAPDLALDGLLQFRGQLGQVVQARRAEPQCFFHLSNTQEMGSVLRPGIPAARSTGAAQCASGSHRTTKHPHREQRQVDVALPHEGHQAVDVDGLGWLAPVPHATFEAVAGHAASQDLQQGGLASTGGRQQLRVGGGERHGDSTKV